MEVEGCNHPQAKVKRPFTTDRAYRTTRAGRFVCGETLEMVNRRTQSPD